MALPREGSRKRLIYEAIQESGLDAALALGLTKLGLKEATIRTWARAWTKGEPQSAEAPQRERANKADPLGRERMQCFGRTCIIVNKGPEQSEVRFDDDRSSRFVCNTWIGVDRVRSNRRSIDE